MAADQFSFLPASPDNEMAQLIRAYDWSQNPIGPMEHWPLSLRSQLHMILTNRFPMLIFWGKELITFYNDAFRPSLGEDGKHPGSLGQVGEESWAESWPVIGPMIYNIMMGGEPVWFEDQKLPLWRDGKMGYAYWTYCFSPLIDDSGNTNGILVSCVEATAGVENLLKLNDAKLQLESAIEAAELGVWDYDPAVGTFTGNARLKAWFGLKPEEEIPLNAAIENIDAADRDRVAASIAASMVDESSSDYREEYGITNPKSGERRILQARGKTSFDANGNAVRLNGTLRDVTEQWEERKRLLSLFEQSPVGIAILEGEDMVFRLANAFYGQLVDRAPEEIIGVSLLDALPELKGQGFDQLLRNVMATGTAFIADEVSVKLKRGQDIAEIFVNLAYQPMKNRDGVVNSILVVATDVTPQVTARKRIQESETKFKMLIEDAPFPTALYVGEDLVIDTANDEMIRLWVKTPKVIGMKLAEALPELDGQPFIELLQEVLRTGIAYSAQEQPASFDTPEGRRTSYYNFTYKPIFNEEGKAYAILNMAVDVTQTRQERISELMKANTDLETANKQLLRSNEDLSQFAYIASHDLQEPLRKIQMFAGLLGDPAIQFEENRNTIAKINASAARMSTLIRDVLNFSRLINGTTERAEVDLNAVVHKVIEDYDMLIEEKRAEIIISNLPVVKAAEVQMYQLFFNLIGNAIKFSGKDKAPQITLKCSREDKRYHITIADQGIGFMPEFADQIFEIFKRLHSKEAYAGTGIGLALCRRIVENHGGEIYAESTPGLGSSFHILLPMNQ